MIAGCMVTDAPTDMIDQAVVSPNGTSWTGIDPHVVSPNGPSTSGLSLTGVDPRGMAASGAPIHAASAGPPLAGSALVGSTWTAHFSDGSAASVRIDAAAAGTGASTELWSYRASAFTGGSWRPLCVDDDGAPGFAESVTGTWNFAQGSIGGGAYTATAQDFTLACRGSSIAKCVEFGYKPWTGHARQLAACVRALRADYCGDGTAYTVTGTQVNIYDDAGIQADTATWIPEAAWTAEGAACISSKQQTRFWQVAHQTPSCFPATLKAKSTCGEQFTGDIAIITELPPR